MLLHFERRALITPTLQNGVKNGVKTNGAL